MTVFLSERCNRIKVLENGGELWIWHRELVAQGYLAVSPCNQGDMILCAAHTYHLPPAEKGYPGHSELQEYQTYAKSRRIHWRVKSPCLLMTEC